MFSSGFLEVNIIEVIDAGHYHAHIADHYELNASKNSGEKALSSRSYSEECFALFMNLSLHFNFGSNHQKVNPSDIKIGELYATNPDNTYFSRVKVCLVFHYFGMML